MTWLDLAHYCYNVYGTYVNWSDRFFICPECGEPIYAEDWEDEPMAIENGYCPVCENLLYEGE